MIVNWNAGEQLLACVSSVIEHTRSLVGQIVVVDNDSNDRSENAVKGLPGVNLIYADKNLGFGKACNLGAVQSRSEFLLFLNPDARVFPDTLAKVLNYMQDHPKIGICGVQLVDEEGHTARSCARFPSVKSLVAHAVGIDRFLPSLGPFMKEWDHASTREVDQVMGAFFLVRRHVFDMLNGFDEKFFVYYEEVDFSYRARQTGWASVYLADARAFHAGGGTSSQVKAKRLFYFLRSRILYAFKHFNPVGATVVLLTTLFIEPLSRSLLITGRRSWSSLKETWDAYGMLVRWLPEWIFKGTTR